MKRNSSLFEQNSPRRRRLSDSPTREDIVTDAFHKACENDVLTEQLTPERLRSILEEHTHPSAIVYTLKAAKQSGLLTGEHALDNITAISQYAMPQALTFVLSQAKDCGLFSGEHAQENVEALLKHPDIRTLSSVLNDAYFANLLATQETTQLRFSQLIRYSDQLLNDTMHRTWNTIPKHLLTETVWNRIMQICRANTINPQAGQIQLQHYIRNEVLGIIPQTHQVFNSTQSTHTASVHKTVSESAIRLKNRYNALVHNNLNHFHQQMTEWVHQQEGKIIEQRFLTHLLTSRFDFLDKVSKITTKQLLALIWIAIQDDSQRAGTLQDAQTLFLEGLFESQRGYNLTALNTDVGGEDRKICASGVFNKMIEKLVGVHPDAEQEFITPQGALLKITPLIIEETHLFLATQSTLDLVNVMSLKAAIFPRVREKLYFEYGKEPFKTFTTPYNTFKEFLGSADYEPFQSELKTNHNDVHLELLIEGKLLAEEPDLDAQLQSIIDKAVNLTCPSEKAQKPTTTRELREARLAFFVNQQDESKQDGESSSSNPKEETTHHP